MLKKYFQPLGLRLASLLLCLLIMQAPVQAAEKFVVASLIGDKISLVRAGMQTRTRLDPNDNTILDLGEKSLDGEVMLIVQRTIKKQCKECTSALLKVKVPDTPEEAENLLPPLLAESQKLGADWLVVLTKYRDAARLRLAGVSLGEGKLSGLGYYVDTSTRVKDASTLETGTGYLAPYAYFKLHVVDVRTGDVKFSKGLTNSSTFSVTGAAGFDVWAAIPEKQKVPALLSLVREELGRVMDLKVMGVLQ